MSQTRRSFWRRSRDWPLVGQLGFALAVILIAAAASGAISNAVHGNASPKRAGTTDNRAGTRSTTRGAVRAVTTIATRPATHAPTSLAVRRSLRSLDPSERLLPLTISSPSHSDTYDRAVDFGDFVHVDGCKDTRAEVLIRTSAVPVSFTGPSDCTVKNGRWVDQWSGITTTVAHDFQVDHTVPLANAWSSGAWSWTQAQRVAYANDLADPDHLVPILTHENESKIDKGPDGWKPPDPAAWCLYARVWDHIKAKWHLSATAAEWDALVEMAGTC